MIAKARFAFFPFWGALRIFIYLKSKSNQLIHAAFVHFQRLAIKHSQGLYHGFRILIAGRFIRRMHGQLRQTDIYGIQGHLRVGNVAQQQRFKASALRL